jgi:hypothetical protein
MVYLSASEFESYGVDLATPPALVGAMSALIDAHCRRPTLAPAQYEERLRLMPDASTVRLTYLPLTAIAPATSPIVAVRGRYAQPRRGDDVPLAPDPQQQLIIEMANAFGLPGQWATIATAGLDFDSDTGELSLTGGLLWLPFNELDVTYTAGLAVISEAVKYACAALIRNAQATPALNVRLAKLDQMQLEYFSNSLIDDTVRQLLAPYVAQKVG